MSPISKEQIEWGLQLGKVLIETLNTTVLERRWIEELIADGKAVAGPWLPNMQDGNDYRIISRKPLPAGAIVRKD